MAVSNCPICGSNHFYVKDPDDEFECYEFECRGGEICFDPALPASAQPQVQPRTEIFCNTCAWHGAFEHLIQEEDAP